MGYFPEGAKPRNLVWDENKGALYVVYYSLLGVRLTYRGNYFFGFRDAMPFQAKGTFGAEW